MKLGKFEIHVVRDGLFKLDGGAMYGIVPKAVWNKLIPADSENRIQLALNCLLIQTGKNNILVDTGIGNKFDAKYSQIYDIQRKEGIVGELAKLQLKPEDIDTVILTHLHFDHCGGSTYKDKDGTLKITFPKATYYVQKGDFEDATHPHERSKRSYLPENFMLLKEKGVLKFTDGDQKILPGISVIKVPGHIKHLQAIVVESEGKKAIYVADLIPTSKHLKIPYTMGYDLDPVTCMDTRKKILEKIVKENILLVFEHDVDTPWAYIQKTGEEYITVKA